MHTAVDTHRQTEAPLPPDRVQTFGDWLLWMLHPRGQEKVAAVLDAYCDESGIQDGAAVCVVAGWVGTSRNWELFEQRWLKASQGVDFHGKQFFVRDGNGARVGPYKEFTDAQADSYLRGVITAIEGSDIKAIGGVVDVAAFKALSVDERKWLTGASWSPRKRRLTTSGAPNKPYYLGFTECLEGAALSVKKPGLQVNFVFDQQNQFAPWALMFFQNAQRDSTTHLSRRLGSVIFQSKAGLGALQAADMLAYALHKYYTPQAKQFRADFRIVTTALDRLVKGRVAWLDTASLRRRLDEKWTPLQS
jgi:Protein of unknown function (DUF3800)